VISPSLSTDAVAMAEVTLVAVPLPRPIRLRGRTIDEREYVVVRIEMEGGLEGAAIGYTRGFPVGEAFARGLPPDGDDPASVRARSLVEIALWDAAARRAELPLWRLLGAARARVPILAVGGYFIEERTLADVQAELRQLVEDGFRHVKVHAHEPRLVASLRDAVPDEAEFSVDLGMRFRDLAEAREACRPLDGLGLAFVEDPFPPELPELTRALADELETPVAAGEDAVGATALLELARAADVARVDATASGGIEAVAAAARAAARDGKPTITHAFVELHGQVAGGLAEISLGETIPYETGANPVDRLLAETQRVEHGELVLSERPGNGLRFDWEAVAHFARDRQIHTSDGRSRCG
jgi:L-alanine-DL-glutamate epimerase-like enolase superfamily enzyme